MGARDSTVTRLEVVVPEEIRSGGPFEDDHLYPLKLVGSCFNSATTSIRGSSPSKRVAISVLPMRAVAPSLVTGYGETELTMPWIPPERSRFTVSGVIRIGIPTLILLPSRTAK